MAQGLWHEASAAGKDGKTDFTSLLGILVASGNR
jgi:hypothetical protein